MFSYYGSKSKIINKYPKPIYNKIIEPFAGSARYSSKYYQYNCWINDLYEVIYNVWKWIQMADANKLDEIPNLRKGQDIRDFNLSKDLSNLLGFALNYASVAPCYIYTTWAARDNEIIRLKNRLSRIIGHINHWEITNLNYLDIPNIEATWFIDAPYQFGGNRYVKNEIDYKELSNWCKSRKGQIIVCENSLADWLPFKQLCAIHGQKHDSQEVIFTNMTYEKVE